MFFFALYSKKADFEYYDFRQHGLVKKKINFLGPIIFFFHILQKIIKKKKKLMVKFLVRFFFYSIKTLACLPEECDNRADLRVLMNDMNDDPGTNASFTVTCGGKNPLFPFFMLLFYYGYYFLKQFSCSIKLGGHIFSCLFFNLFFLVH